MTTTIPELSRLISAEKKRRNRRKALLRTATWLLTTTALAFTGGWQLMLAVGIAHQVWLPKLPTIGYWWAVLLVYLLRGTFSTVPARNKDKDDAGG